MVNGQFKSNKFKPEMGSYRAADRMWPATASSETNGSIQETCK